MEYRDFAYWLQGYFELSGATSVTKEQLQVIRNHLNLALKYNQDKSIQTTTKEYFKNLPAGARC